MKAIEYWNRVVQPLVTRFESEPTSYDLAFASCIVINHVTDYLKSESEKTAAHFRGELVRMNLNFATIFAVASAVKHIVANDKNHGLLAGLKSGEADVGKGAAFSDGTYWDDGTSWSDSPDVVRVYAPDGHVVDLHWLVDDVTKTIKAYLMEQG